jgi:type IV pilus assembly protein PilW
MTNKVELLLIVPGKHDHQNGLTLIELMVSMAIGLILAIVASSVYLYSKQSYNAVSETSQIEENGRFALNLIARHIQTAGYVALDPKSKGPVGPADTKITGCDFGMVNAKNATALSDLACLSSTPSGSTRSAVIGTFFETDAYNTSGATFQGFDCLGNRAVSVPSTVGGSPTLEIRSYFFVSSSTSTTPNGTTTIGQLSCATNPAGSTATWQPSQPLIPGIQQLAFNYLTPSGISKNTAQKSNTAADLTTAGTWADVTGVIVCVLSKSIQPTGNDTQVATKDCFDNTITALPGESYRRFTTMVNLRNKI